MAKGVQSDENGTKQSNKRHNKKNTKLVQKKKYKKNKSKFMSMRAELRKKKIFKDSMRKMSITSERFAYKVHVDEIEILKQIVGKLLKYNSETEDSMPILFKQLDDGASIDISGLDDNYV